MNFLKEIVLLFGFYRERMRESKQPKPSEPRRSPNTSVPPRRIPPRGGRRPQRMRLPFEHRPFDIGTWIYEHRVGLCCMVIAYLAFGIVFVSTKIVLNTQKYDNTLYVDLTDLQQQLMEEERLNQQLQQEEEEESTPLRNRVSDVHGGAESVGRWDESSQEASESESESDFQESLDEEAAAVASRLRASREAFEKGRREEQEMIDRHKAQREAKEGEQESGVKQQGNVLVEYDLPGRRDVSLFIPAYLCEGSGRVVVSITVNRNGKVTAASVKEGSGSSCINDSAVRAARNSTFNVDPSRDKQSGTITYRFVPQ